MFVYIEYEQKEGLQKVALRVFGTAEKAINAVMEGMRLDRMNKKKVHRWFDKRIIN